MSPSRKSVNAPLPGRGKKNAYADLLRELATLHRHLMTMESESTELLQKVDARHRASAANLIHYLGLRRRDMRPLQKKLAAAGLSSMGRAESHVLSNLRTIIVLLERALGKQAQQAPFSHVDSSATGPELLETNTDKLLGKPPAQRLVRIMVTLPCEAADDYTLVKEMLLQGMDCARINCAHDDADVWKRMIKQITRARRETGRHCRILMDLGGPKLRTGEIALGPAVLKWKPKRDPYGKVTEPVRIWLYPEDDASSYPEHDASSCPAHAHACFPVKGNWLEQVTARDRIEFNDARGALCRLQLVGQAGTGYWAESTQTAYVKPGLKLSLLRAPVSGHARGIGESGEAGALPQAPEKIRLYRGDSLIVTCKPTPGRPARFDKRGRLLRAASISCSLPEVFACVRAGERILIDDGRIGGVIRSVNAGEMRVEITQARDSGEKLLPDKGINLPDSQLDLDGLTALDIVHLEFVARHADMVGLSFVQGPADIALLQEQLKRLDADKLGIVVKIETRTAFEQLPELMFTL
ncbi:MAG: pyruvate kinase, partial [Nitrosospira sp.]|nr:pyruvate kinase [Nitrosospira sp.]